MKGTAQGLSSSYLAPRRLDGFAARHPREIIQRRYAEVLVNAKPTRSLTVDEVVIDELPPTR